MKRTATIHQTSSRNRTIMRVLLALLMLGPAWGGGSARMRMSQSNEAAPELTWTTDSGEPRQATLRLVDFTPLPAIKPKKGDFRSVWKIPAPGAAVIPETVGASDSLLSAGLQPPIPGAASRRLLSPRSPRAPPCT